MSQASLVAGVYKKKKLHSEAWSFAPDNKHQVRIDLNNVEMDFGRSEVKFASNDYPYLKVALFDKYLEDDNDTE